MRTRPAILASLAVALAGLTPSMLSLAPSAAAAQAPRVSFTDIESEVMCVSCNEPLVAAESPQSLRERSEIRGLIAQGDTKAQIERTLVAEYGDAVLALPPAHGLNLTVYILPPAIVIAGLVALAVTLPRWRRRARAAAARPVATGAGLSSADAQRLDHDLAQFKG